MFNSGSTEGVPLILGPQVGSRRVVQASAVVMMVLGSFCKLSALWATVPVPVIASLYFVLFSYIVTASLPTILMVNIHSSRNLFILGFTVFFSLSVSKVSRICLLTDWFQHSICFSY